MSCDNDNNEKLHLSHDLRVQMQLVSGAVQIIKDIAGSEAITTGQQDVTNFISLIQDSTQRMLGMINQVMEEISASEVSQVNDLREVVHCVIQSMRPIAQTHGYDIRFVIHGTPMLDCCRGKLERVLYNLLTNSVKYASPNTQIQVEACQVGDIIELTVEDIGCGLNPAQVDLLIFGCCEDDSLGLNECYGLRSINRLTQEMGGVICVEKLLPQRNRIKIIFPGKS